MIDEIEMEGKTVEEAIKAGLEKLGCSRDKVEIKILNEGNSGLFGLMGSKPATVRMSLKGEYDYDYVLAQNKIKEFLTTMFKKMSIKVNAINTALISGRILAEIKSDENSLLIGRNGQTLDALEYILNLMLRKDEKTRVKVNLDIESYRRRQEEKIQSIAEKAAMQVKKNGKPYRFDPMSAKDRRLIHVALKGDQDVETVSEGEGAMRKVVVKLKK